MGAWSFFGRLCGELPAVLLRRWRDRNVFPEGERWKRQSWAVWAITSSISKPLSNHKNSAKRFSLVFWLEGLGHFFGIPLERCWKPKSFSAIFKWVKASDLLATLPFGCLSFLPLRFGHVGHEPEKPPGPFAQFRKSSQNLNAPSICLGLQKLWAQRHRKASIYPSCEGTVKVLLSVKCCPFFVVLAAQGTAEVRTPPCQLESHVAEEDSLGTGFGSMSGKIWRAFAWWFWHTKQIYQNITWCGKRREGPEDPAPGCRSVWGPGHRKTIQIVIKAPRLVLLPEIYRSNEGVHCTLNKSLWQLHLMPQGTLYHPSNHYAYSSARRFPMSFHQNAIFWPRRCLWRDYQARVSKISWMTSFSAWRPLP